MTGEKFFTAGGYIGIALIQGSTLPSLIGYGMGWTHELPPLSMTLLVWLGLACFLARSIYMRQTLYIISEGLGMLLQSVILMLIFLP
jgi:hypothetical protein